jgi:hypothetical protein
VARFENLWLAHDYVAVDKDFYKSFLDFDTDWDNCMCQIINRNGVRFRDWCTFGMSNPYKRPYMLPDWLHYDDTRFTNNHCYISGTFHIVKRQYLLDHPFDEQYSWGQGEDVHWAIAHRGGWKYKMNKKARVHLLKQKGEPNRFSPEDENATLADLI